MVWQMIDCAGQHPTFARLCRRRGLRTNRAVAFLVLGRGNRRSTSYYYEVRLQVDVPLNTGYLMTNTNKNDTYNSRLPTALHCSVEQI